MFERVRLTRLFQSFQAHYGFEYVFCNAYAGATRRAAWSPGSARCAASCSCRCRACGACRRSTPGCLNGALALGDKDHYRKGGRETDLFAEDRKALLALPETRFDVVTWKRMKADKYGIVTVEGRHRYAAGPEHAGRELIVGLRAFEVELLDASGARITTHPRAYGDNPTSSDGPVPADRAAVQQARGLAPTARSGRRFPTRLREWLDGQERAVLAEGLRTLRQAERESGWANAVAAMAEILETTGGIDRAGVCLAAARHAAGTEPVAYDEPVDLTEYDLAFAGREDNA